jgi:hypothetical protein
VEVNDSALEAVLVEKLQLHPDVVWQGALAASHQGRAQEHMALVDQSGVQCVGGELGTTN